MSNGTPEAYLNGPKGEDIDTDAVGCALDRAKSISIMLQTAYNGAGGIKLNDELTANYLWAIEGFIDQANILISGK